MLCHDGDDSSIRNSRLLHTHARGRILHSIICPQSPAEQQQQKEYAPMQLELRNLAGRGGEGDHGEEVGLEGWGISSPLQLPPRRSARSFWGNLFPEGESQLGRIWICLCSLQGFPVAGALVAAFLAGHILVVTLGRFFFLLPVAVLALLDSLCFVLLLHGYGRDSEGKSVACFCLHPAVVGIFALIWAVVAAPLSYLASEVSRGIRDHVTVEADGRIALGMETLAANLRRVEFWLQISYTFRLLIIPVALYFIVASLRTRFPRFPAVCDSGIAFDAARSLSLGIAATLLALVFLAGQSLFVEFKKGPDSDNYDGCDPIDATLCALPWPNDFFTVADPSRVTGRRLSVGAHTFPLTRSRGHVNPQSYNDLDGFSTLAPILFYLPGMSSRGLPGVQHPEMSLADNSTTWLIKASTGERVAHFVELDALDPSAPLAIMQPAQPLDHAQRYVVAVSGITDKTGAALPQTPGFKDMLLAAEGGSSVETPDRALHFRSNIFPVLERAGLTERSAIQLAFDFTTRSAEQQLGLLKTIRDDALLRMDTEGGPRLEIVSKEVDEQGFLQVWATIAVPDYFGLIQLRSATAEPEHIMRAPGWVQVGILIRIPKTIHTGERRPSCIVQYGHGLFADRSEVLQEKFLDRLAEEEAWIITSVDWQGMSRFDLPAIARILISAPEQFPVIVGHLMQSFVNGELLLRCLSLNWTELAGVATDNKPSPTLAFYGISQGGILGAGYTAFSPQIERSVLGVPGTPFALLLSRSLDFAFYHALLKLNFSDSRDIRLLLSLIQSHWDSVEASGWLAAPSALNNYASGKSVLLQAGLGDAEVSTVGAQILARAYHASAVQPAPVNTFNVPNASNPPACGGALFAIYDYQEEWSTVPTTNVAPTFNWVHFCVRHDPDAQRQVVHFLSTGCVVNFCDGACVREKCTTFAPLDR